MTNFPYADEWAKAMANLQRAILQVKSSPLAKDDAASATVKMGDPVDDFAIGWRFWATFPHTVGIYGQVYPERWNDAQWTEAICGVSLRFHGTDSPELWCTCGLYVRHFNASFGQHTAPLSRPIPGISDVVGAVLAKGRIIEHGVEGFRAQYAKPIALAASVNHRGAHLIAQAYEIPLLPLGDLRDYALKFGREVCDA